MCEFLSWGRFDLPPLRSGKNESFRFAFFPDRSPRSGREPEGFKGGKPAGQMEMVFNEITLKSRRDIS
jgi:hypothetical protein